jgi:hypothetical protein
MATLNIVCFFFHLPVLYTIGTVVVCEAKSFGELWAQSEHSDLVQAHLLLVNQIQLDFRTRLAGNGRS